MKKFIFSLTVSFALLLYFASPAQAYDTCASKGISTEKGLVARMGSDSPHTISVSALENSFGLRSGEKYLIKIFDSTSDWISTENSAKVVAGQITEPVGTSAERTLNTANFNLVEPNSTDVRGGGLIRTHHVFLYPEVLGPNVWDYCYLGYYQMLKEGITQAEIDQLRTIGDLTLPLQSTGASCGTQLTSGSATQCNCGQLEGTCCGWWDRTTRTCSETNPANESGQCGAYDSTTLNCTTESGSQLTKPFQVCGAVGTNSTICCQRQSLCPAADPTSCGKITYVQEGGAFCTIGSDLIAAGQFATCGVKPGECCRNQTQCTTSVPSAEKCGDIIQNDVSLTVCRIGGANYASNYEVCDNNTQKCCYNPGKLACNELYPAGSGGGTGGPGSGGAGGGAGGGGSEDANLDGGLMQGPTVADFDALNPLKTENSAQAVRLSTPGGIVTRFLQFAFPIAGLILFAMLSWAGFEILTGATNSKSLDAGKQRATAAIVGFLLLFASYWLMQIVEVIFGISVL